MIDKLIYITAVYSQMAVEITKSGILNLDKSSHLIMKPRTMKITCLMKMLICILSIWYYHKTLVK
jgi:hypothetical protein